MDGGILNKQMGRVALVWEVRTAGSCIHTYACVFVQCMCPREGVCVKERVRACVYVCV